MLYHNFNLDANQRLFGQPLIVLAALNNQANIARFLVQKDVDVNTYTIDNAKNSLIIAAKNGYYEVAKALVKSIFINVNLRDKYDKTALIIAAENKNYKLFNLLLKRGADLTLTYCFGQSGESLATWLHPIFKAIKFHDFAETERLCASGIDLDTIVDEEERTPLALAMEQTSYNQTNLKLMDILLKNGANPEATHSNAISLSPLMAAATEKDLRPFEKLIEYNANPKTRDQQGMTPLIYLALYNPDSLDRYLAFEEVEKFKLAAKTFVALGLLYSQNNFSSDYVLAIEQFKFFLQNSAFDKIKAEKYKEILDAIKKGSKIKNIDGTSFRPCIAPYLDHASYFIIHYDSQEKPQKLSYCDSNLPLSPPQEDENGKRYGEVVFALKNGTDEKKLNSIIGNKIAPSYTKEGFDDQFFLDSLSDFIETDEEGIPLCEHHVLTVPQKKGNCVEKSTHIASRALARLTAPQILPFYKEYKYSTILAAHKTLFNLLENPAQNKDQEYYAIMLRCAQSCLLHAAAKDHVELMEALKTALNQAKQAGCEVKDFNDIKNDERGENPLMLALRRQNLRAIDWCLKNGITRLEKDTLGENPLNILLKNQAIAKIFLDNGIFHDVKDNESAFLLAISCANKGNNQILKALIDGGVNINKTDEDKVSIIDIIADRASKKNNYNLDAFEMLANHPQFNGRLSDGQEIKEWAQQNDIPSIAALMIKWEEKKNARPSANPHLEKILHLQNSQTKIDGRA